MEDALASKQPSPPASASPCDVIVPVFNGYEATRRCLDTLARHTPAAHRILLVDDASTDPRIAPLLKQFAAQRSTCEVLDNPQNLGFTGAVNRALERTSGDVIILNSDTEVTAGWLEAMLRCLKSDAAIGIVCPLSNRATILSLNGVPELYLRPDGTQDVDAIAQCMRRAATREYPRLPTAVGFCMLVSREVIERCGTLDPVYGRGYGEECDLSMRALDMGIEIACCDDAYVHHAGEASFGAVAGIARERERNRVTLEHRWPMYAPGVAAWTRANPLRRAAERVNAEAERERRPGTVRVLQVLHRYDSRGGIEVHTRAIIDTLKDNAAFTVAHPGPEKGLWTDFTIERPQPHLRMARLNFDLARFGILVIGHPANAADAGIEEAFRGLLEGGYDIVHFQSLVGWNTLRLPRLAREAGARVVVSAHDLSMLCADYNMITGAEGKPCGRTAARGTDTGCVACLRGKSEALAIAGPPRSIGAYIEERFAAASDAVAAADAIVCPSAYVAGRMRSGFGEACTDRLRVIGHGVADLPNIHAPSEHKMLRVACLGRFSDRKGAHVLLDAARRLAGANIVFELWGVVEQPLAMAAQAAGFVVRGQYHLADLPRVLRGIDLVIVPTMMEESFCLVVSEAQALGIPVAASRIGAIPERIRDGETGFLFPPGDPEAIARLLLELRDDRAMLAAVAERLRTERPKTIDANALEYLALYRELAAMPREALPAAASDSSALVRRCFDLPRTRTHTRLGTQAFDRWLGLEAAGATKDTTSAQALHVITLTGDVALRDLNAAIAASPSAWIVITEAGDRLAPDALPCLAQASLQHPGATLLYANHDAISLKGERYDPVFKPALDAELLRHAPCIAGLCAIHRDRVVARGGLLAQGWAGIVDLALRLAEEAKPGAAVALPQLLVHRSDLNLRALGGESNLRRFREVVVAHFTRIGSQATLSPASADMPEHWAFDNTGAGKVPVFIQCAEAPEQAVNCLAELARGGIDEFLIDLDAPRCRELAERLSTQGLRFRITPVAEPGRSSLAVALRRANTEWLAVVDARCHNFRPGWLERLRQGVADRFTACVTADLVDAMGQRTCEAEVVGAGPWAIAGPPPARRETDALADLYGRPRKVSSFTGRIALLRREAVFASDALEDLAAAGRFGATHLSLCLARAGFDIHWRPFVAADLSGLPAREADKAAPAQSVTYPAELEWMRQRWGAALESDPCFPAPLSIGGPVLEPEAILVPPTGTASGTLRICAFPFDQWGSGELRVRQPCAALERAGHAQVLMMPGHESGRAPNLLEWKRAQPDVLYALNFFHNYQLRWLEDCARNTRALKVLGMDDLLSNLPPDNPYAATIYRDIGDRIIRAAALCDRLVVSTPELADAYGKLARDVRVIPNALDTQRWQGLDNRPRNGDRPRVGWAGARQHLNDLLLLEPVVRATCKDIDWVFFGMCPAEIRPMAAEFIDMVPLAEYPEKLASLGLDVAVAPLVDNPFNRAKSNLKLLEFGFLGVPVLCSDLAPYRDSPATRIGPKADDWIEALRSLCADRGNAVFSGKNLRNWVLQHHTLTVRLPLWEAAIRPGG